MTPEQEKAWEERLDGIDFKQKVTDLPLTSDDILFLAADAELKVLRKENESLRGKLCRARELKDSILIERISDLPPREWMMRPSDRDTRDWFGEMDHVLESPPSPCRHEERVKELEENIWQLRPLVRNMEDMPKEFQEIINTHFWELLLDNSTAE